MALSTAARRLVLLALLLGLAGTIAELLLLGHYEDWRQRIPLVLLAVALLLLAAFGLSRRAGPLRALRWIAVAALLAGCAGVYFHLQGNAEFERERVPGIGGWELLRETFTGATPALAPGTMVQLGLLLWLYLYRHPALSGRRGDHAE